MKILVMGLMHHRYNALPISNALEEMGHTVVKIALDKGRCSSKGIELNLRDEIMKKYRSINEVLKADTCFRRIKLYEYISPVLKEGNFDFILYIQCHEYAFDFSKIDVPIYYYFTEIIWPQLPLGSKIKGLFYGFPKGDGVLGNAHPFEVNMMYFKQYIPYGFDPQLFSRKVIPFSERKIPYSFMGSLFMASRGTNLESEIYLHRKDIIEFMLDQYPGFVYRNSNTYEKYLDLLYNSKISINIPATDCLNQRQLEIIASGSILLQWNYEGLEELGFIDKVNCLLFSSKEEIKEKIFYIMTHPEEAKKIQEQALLLAQKYTYAENAKKIIDRITRPLTFRENQIVEQLDTQMKLNDRIINPARYWSWVTNDM